MNSLNIICGSTKNQGLLDRCYHQLIDNLDDARAVQVDLVGLMAGRYQHAGYKVGLTDRKAQEMFWHTSTVGRCPVQGNVSTGRSCYRAGFRHVAAGGTGSAGAGKNRLKSIRPYQLKTLPGILMQSSRLLNYLTRCSGLMAATRPPLLLAGNVGSRWGVTGTPVTVVSAQDLVEYLPAMDAASGDGYRRSDTPGAGKPDFGTPIKFRTVFY